MRKEVAKESIKFEAKFTTYKNESGFKIIAGVAYAADTGDRICKCSIKGQLYDVEDGDSVFVSGNWDDHPKYGLGFKVDAYVKVIPADEKSILTYLQQGNIAGISKKRAEMIVARFKGKTFDILVNHTERLLEIKGIGEKSIPKIHDSSKKNLEEQQMVSSIMMYIQDFDISPAYAQRIYKRYGIKSMEVIRKNPYQLAEDVKGIGFLKADEIALKNGIAPDSPFRVESAVLYVLGKMNEEGDVFGTEKDVEFECSKLLSLDVSYVDTAIDSLTKKKKIIKEDDALYPVKLFNAEEETAEKLVRLLTTSAGNYIDITADDVIKYGEAHHIEYAEEQINAIVTACKSNVMILTGGPGTGKTTTVKGIIAMFKNYNLRVLCAAPTGKASKRMKGATGENAKTVHKILEVRSDAESGFKFGKNEHSPLDADALVIDESSMIDTMLMNSILKAVPETMKLILVGDIDQLPSVGCGNVLHDMIKSGVIPTVRLTKIFRQAEQSDIVKNAHLINQGIIPPFKNRKDGDYFFMDVAKRSQEEIRDSIVEYVCEKLPKFYGVDPSEIQVLAPMKKGHTGVIELNDYIQNRLNPPIIGKEAMFYGDRILREGDRIMYTCNDYDKEVFNGDVGKIVSIVTVGEDDEDNCGKRYFKVDFDGRIVSFDINEASDFMLAYATTIHKSQGSEYDIVVMPLTNSNYMMLQRNLLYTGVTRAKKVFVLFGQKQAVATAIKTLKVVKRNTRLAERIVNAAGLLAYDTFKTA